VALNLFSKAYPEGQRPEPPSGTGAVSARTWPPVVGEFFVSQDHRNGPFAVSTLASIPLAEALARIKPDHLCIVGKTETENIGIEKIIQNAISNPAIHFLILAGKDPEGHRSGATLLALCRKGVDAGMKVIGSPGRRAVLRNVSRGEVEAFRSQIKVVDMIGCQDVKKIISKMKKLASGFHRSCSRGDFSRLIKPLPASGVEIFRAGKSKKVTLDKSGYFVVLPVREKGRIHVEHYSTDNRLLRVIEGDDAVGLYRMIIENGWITELTHAAYLGKELEKAELSLKLGFKYVQDGT
jgi:tetrahydromethanopterin S-methyltransferase subunit A